MTKVTETHSYGIKPMYGVDHKDYKGCWWYSKETAEKIAEKLNEEESKWNGR